MEILFSEVLVTVVLFVWVVFLVTFLTKRIYEFMKKRGLRDNVVVYYNRKIIHILAGGLVAIIKSSSDA
ncbi:MAG: hypothetical protein QXU63_04375 [Nitrososphaerota archaeon]